MANAICVDCGSVIHWHAQRGAKLSDFRCTCGGRLQGMTAGRKNDNAGLHYGTCAVCGRRRLRLFTTKRKWTLSDGRQLAEGTRVCGWHDVRLPDEACSGGWRYSSVRSAEHAMAAREASA